MLSSQNHAESEHSANESTHTRNAQMHIHSHTHTHTPMPTNDSLTAICWILNVKHSWPWLSVVHSVLLRSFRDHKRDSNRFGTGPLLFLQSLHKCWKHQLNICMIPVLGIMLNCNRWWGCSLEVLQILGTGVLLFPRSTLAQTGDARQGSSYESNSLFKDQTKLFSHVRQSTYLWGTDRQVGNIFSVLAAHAGNPGPNILGTPLQGIHWVLSSAVCWWLGKFNNCAPCPGLDYSRGSSDTHTIDAVKISLCIWLRCFTRFEGRRYKWKNCNRSSL